MFRLYFCTEPINKRNMKKLMYYLFLILCITSAKAYSQDLIVTNDSQKIEAKIIEVSDDAVRYKKFSNQDGPAFVIKTDKIASIIYQNGEVQTFAVNPAASQGGKNDGDYCFDDIINTNTECENYIFVYNCLNEDFDFKLFGMEHRSGSSQLVCKDVVKPGEYKRLSTVFDDGRLDHFYNYRFCPSKKIECEKSIAISNHNMYIILYNKTDENLFLDITKFKKDYTVRMRLGNALHFESDWVNVYSASNPKKKIDDPNFTNADDKHSKLSDDPEELLNTLKKIDGDAIIEVTVNDKQKIRETISKTTIDKLVADFEAASGKKIK